MHVSLRLSPFNCFYTQTRTQSYIQDSISIIGRPNAHFSTTSPRVTRQAEKGRGGSQYSHQGCTEYHTGHATVCVGHGDWLQGYRPNCASTIDSENVEEAFSEHGRHLGLAAVVSQVSVSLPVSVFSSPCFASFCIFLFHIMRIFLTTSSFELSSLYVVHLGIATVLFQ